LGGLLAGLVINIVEFITNGVVLREAWGQAMQALGKPTQLSAGQQLADEVKQRGRSRLDAEQSSPR